MEENQTLMASYNMETTSAKRIQKAWRKFVYRKIFKYIKDILLNKLKSVNPWKLLKIMNPKEIQLIESCVNMHIRFRLGGENFPPQIYYKVYSNGNVSDINSYAPRNYAKIKQKYPKMSLKQYQIYSKKHPLDGWYKKTENNDWRPLDSKLTKVENLEYLSGSRVKYYHHKKDKRSLKKAKFHKLNKLRWLQTMYKKGKLEEKNAKNLEDMQPELDQILESENFLLNEDPILEKEAEDLIKWADELTFDKYIDDWFFKSTVFVNFDLANNPLLNEGEN